MKTSLETLLEVHSNLLEKNPYCYFELAYTRQTGWCAWLCDKPLTDSLNRRVLAKGQGDTPEKAAEATIQNYDLMNNPDDEKPWLKDILDEAKAARATWPEWAKQ